MGLKEKLLGIIPEDKKPPIRPNSINNLAEVLEKEGCTSVVLSPVVNESGKRDPNVYIHSIYAYRIVFATQTLKGRKVEFIETVHEWERIVKRFEDIMHEAQVFPLTRENNSFRTFLNALERKRMLQEKIPAMQVNIMSGNEIMTEDWIQETRRMALSRNLTPWEPQS